MTNDSQQQGCPCRGSGDACGCRPAQSSPNDLDALLEEIVCLVKRGEWPDLSKALELLDQVVTIRQSELDQVRCGLAELRAKIRIKERMDEARRKAGH